jgi:cytoskeleton protein RodZ
MKTERYQDSYGLEDAQDSGPAPEDRALEDSGQAGIGAFLKKEREKKGLSYAQVSEMIRVRPYMLEALENEDWENLPAPVFVRGFVRSYVRALGIEEEAVEGFYPKTDLEDRSPERSLLRPAKREKSRTVWWIGSAVVLAGLLVYFVASTMPRRGGEASLEALSPAAVETAKSETVPQETQEAVRETEEGSQKETAVTSERSPTVESATESLPQESLAAPGMDETPPEASVSEEPVPGTEERPIGSSPPEGAAADAQPSPLVLKAHVKEGTWLRIFVDDQEPKEYIFRSGSRPEWKADKGFELLIGNAGGIDLEFNGEKMGKLGALGKVVRLKLPESYERTANE